MALSLVLPIASRCGSSHRAELRPITADIGDLMSDDQLVLGINGHLYVEAHHPRALVTCRHRARIGIRHRVLSIWQRLDFFLHLVKAIHLLAQWHKLPAQSGCLERYLRWLRAIRSLQRA